MGLLIFDQIIPLKVHVSEIVFNENPVFEDYKKNRSMHEKATGYLGFCCCPQVSEAFGLVPECWVWGFFGLPALFPQKCPRCKWMWFKGCLVNMFSMYVPLPQLLLLFTLQPLSDHLRCVHVSKAFKTLQSCFQSIAQLRWFCDLRLKLPSIKKLLR